VKKQFLATAAVIATLGGALAQGANPPAATQDQRPHRDFAAFLDRRIDRLKTALKITPAQEPQFNQLAQVMRDNAAEMQKTFGDLRGNRGQHLSAVDRLQTDVQLTQLRASQDQRYLDALKPLYASLSADQKQVADRMLAPHRFARGRHRA